MKHPYKLTTINIIFLIIIGTTIGVFLITIIFSFLTWLLLGRKENGGSIVFNVVIMVIFLSQLSFIANKNHAKNKPIQDLESAMADYKDMNESHPDSVVVNYNKCSNSIKTGMDELIKTSTGTEKEFNIILRQSFEESDSVSTDWSKSYEKIIDTRLLDYSLLNTKEEFSYQLNATDEYIKNQKLISFF